MVVAAVFFWLFLLGGSIAAYAEIGGPPDPRTVPARILAQGDGKAVIVRERVSGSLRVQEYLWNGKVFGTCWTGARMPNMKNLFGSRYVEYEAAHKQRILRGESVMTSDMVVQTGGHMRDLHGVALIPSLAPPGFSGGQLRCLK